MRSSDILKAKYESAYISWIYNHLDKKYVYFWNWRNTYSFIHIYCHFDLTIVLIWKFKRLNYLPFYCIGVFRKSLKDKTESLNHKRTSCWFTNSWVSSANVNWVEIADFIFQIYFLHIPLPTTKLLNLTWKRLIQKCMLLKMSRKWLTNNFL